MAMWPCIILSPYMFQATSLPILRSTFWLYVQLLVQCTDTAADLCHGWDGINVPAQPCVGELYQKQKVLLRMGKFVARNM